MSEYYKLDKDHNIVASPLLEWAEWFGNIDERLVANTDLGNGYVVSTVFLGIDHSFGDGPPLLFETMVFPQDKLDEQDMDRYSTWDEAVAGHKAMVEKWQKH